MAWPAPQYSKNRIRRAGKNLVAAHREKEGRVLWKLDVAKEDLAVIENWRTSHGAVLNTAQAWLRRLDNDNRPVVGQRLKRHETIVDKLTSGRSKDLSTMHDIAGVRAIFRSIEEIELFRDRMSKSKARHIPLNDPEKFDYIKNPKTSGYRGVHQVMERVVGIEQGNPWNGLKFEVQLRTAVQHAWATAVEIYDSTRAARFKFSKSSNPAYEQFLIASELFARIHEGRSGCLSQETDAQLEQRFIELEAKTQMVTMIHGLRVAETSDQLGKNSILQRRTNGDLYIYRFKSFPQALRAISDIETRSETQNAVLVGANTPLHIRDAFRNYFDDTSDFIDLLDDALRQIRATEIVDLWNE